MRAKTIYVRDEHVALWKELDKLAKKQKLAVSELIANAIMLYINNNRACLRCQMIRRLLELD